MMATLPSARTTPALNHQFDRGAPSSELVAVHEFRARAVVVVVVMRAARSDE